MARSIREGKIEAALENPVRQKIDKLFSAASEISPAESIRHRAIQLGRAHPLRAADALQLAAALIWCGDRPKGVEFVCLDARLREAGLKEGFDVLPGDYPQGTYRFRVDTAAIR